MLSPLLTAGCFVMDSGQKPELLKRDLCSLDTKLMVEFALSGPLYALYRLLQ